MDEPIRQDGSAPLVAGILLAGGGSDRMGRAKLLLRLGGRRVIDFAVDALEQSGCAPALVVLGSQAGKMSWHLAGRQILLTRNTEWAEGIGGSIARGMQVLLQADPDAQAVIFIAADQPLVDAAHLRRLITTWTETGAAAVASTYEDTVGIPALFTSPQFVALSALEGDEGAKKVLEGMGDSVVRVPCPGAAFDVDTQEDLEIVAGKLTAV